MKSLTDRRDALSNDLRVLQGQQVQCEQALEMIKTNVVRLSGAIGLLNELIKEETTAKEDKGNGVDISSLVAMDAEKENNG